jgi:hypothetical protein
MRDCLYCHKPFIPWNPSFLPEYKFYQRYCSKQCRNDGRYEMNREKRLAGIHPDNQKAADARMAVLQFLGNICVRCGFHDSRALQIDHKNGGGCADIRNNGAHARYQKIYNNPTDYQILCANCNWIKRAERREVPRVFGRRPGRKTYPGPVGSRAERFAGSKHAAKQKRRNGETLGFPEVSENIPP